MRKSMKKISLIVICLVLYIFGVGTGLGLYKSDEFYYFKDYVEKHTSEPAWPLVTPDRKMKKFWLKEKTINILVERKSAYNF